MDVAGSRKFLEFVSPFISENKKERSEKVILDRTRYLTIVLEDIYQSQNANAVVRTCECLGVQDIHVIEKKNKYNTNRDVLRGSGKWVNLLHYDSKKATEECFGKLRDNGYRIVGASPEATNAMEDMDVNNKLAIIFGTELEGLSAYACENVDEIVKIPMFGFTESFNLSVSAAIMMNSLVRRMKKELDPETWKLTEEEQLELKIDWYLKVVKNPEKLQREFYRLTAKVK